MLDIASDKLIYNCEMVGKRIGKNLDGSRPFLLNYVEERIRLPLQSPNKGRFDKGRQTYVEQHVHTSSAVYKKLIQKDEMFESPR